MTVEAICWLVIGAVLMGVMWLTSSERDLFVARRDWPTARRLKRRDATVLRSVGAEVRR